MVMIHFDNDDYKWKVKSSRKYITPPEKSLKNNIVYTKHYPKKNVVNTPKINHVVVKITGGAKDNASMKNHFDYISRNNSIAIFDKDAQYIKLNDVKNDVKTSMELDVCRADSKRTYQIMFSTHGKNDEEDLKKAVLDTMNKEFPDNQFYIAIHQDTANTHAHVVLVRNGGKKRAELTKRKLNALKKRYAESLNKRGIASFFESESEKQKKTVSKGRKRVNSNVYEVVDFGKAKYKFDDNGKSSFYLMLKTNNGVYKEHWSLGLEQALKEKSVSVGDKITVKKTNTIDKDKFTRSTWEIEVKEKGNLIVESTKPNYLHKEHLSKKSFSKQKKLSTLNKYSVLQKYSEQPLLTKALKDEHNTKQSNKTNLYSDFGGQRKEGDSPHSMQSLPIKRNDGAEYPEWLLYKGVLFSHARNHLGQAQRGAEQYSSVQSLRRLRLRRGGVTPQSEFMVLDFGKANYKFDTNNKQSYYMLIKDKSLGKITDLWSKELEDYIKKQGIKIGDTLINKNSELIKKSKASISIKPKLE